MAGKSLRQLRLRVLRAAVESLWNCGRGGKGFSIKPISGIDFPNWDAPKTLNSNQLANSLGINMGGGEVQASDSQIGDLHIWGLYLKGSPVR